VWPGDTKLLGGKTLAGGILLLVCVIRDIYTEGKMLPAGQQQMLLAEQVICIPLMGGFNA